MEYREFIRMLVDTEDPAERMALAEEHMEAFENTEAGGEDLSAVQASLAEAITQIEELTASNSEKDQKFKDRFFSKPGSENQEEQEENQEDQEDEEEKPKSLQDLGYAKSSRT